MTFRGDRNTRQSARALPPPVIPIAAALAIVALAASSTIALLGPAGEDTLARIARGEALRIGYAVEAPYSFVKNGGEVTGQSPAVARAVAARLGITRLEWRQLEFGSLIAGLEAGRFDVIAAGMFITRERAGRVAFSEPVFRALQGLLVRRGNPKALRSYRAAAETAGVRIAVLAGAVEETFLTELGLVQSLLIRVPDAMTGRSAVASSLADGLALSAAAVRWMAADDDSGLTEAAAPFDGSSAGGRARESYGAFAFRKNDLRLLEAWNRVLVPYLGSDEHFALVAEFGFSLDDSPGMVTTRELLAWR